jgi:hypothetical protein
LELFDKISDITKSAASKTANKVTITKLNARINSLKTAIGAQKLKIGEYYWARLHEDASFEPEIAEAFGAIKNLAEQIASVEAEIQGILEGEKMAELERAERAQRTQSASAPGGPTCPSCGASNLWGANFCGGCGGSLAGVSPEGACAKCGAPMDDSAAFCERCGAKREIIGASETNGE